ncbi:MAG: hypothetical protein CSA34_01775 [Desulfobulbus propionicus]|nr:MAG: hypothetical protein CSA34_01775 [Desulfobulbus propionicus]
MSLSFTVAERGRHIPVTREQLTLYSGPSQIIATALMFRLFRRAITDLSPETPPERTAFSTLVAFPGPGILDCIEYVTRARTHGPDRLIIDTEAGPEDAPRAPKGRFYFELEINGRRRAYWPAPGLFDETFLEMVRRYQPGENTPAEEAAYQQFKQQMVGKLLGAPGPELFRSA